MRAHSFLPSHSLGP
uniref:14 amino acid ORF protein n=1 Tax=Homo sapiens TaxID=9606 RepID=V9H114_HUMAN|nr:hypothetical protein 1 estrogen receptor 5'-region - human [Homo sapiens]CAA44319.1 14 amino acid ORF [Homo sapiens]